MVAASLGLDLIFGGDRSGWKFWVMQALYTTFIGGSAFLYAAVSKTDFPSATKFDQRPPAAHVVWGCVSVVCLICCMSQINGLFLDLIEALGLNRPSVDLEDSFFGLIICACLLPAFTEEVLFRGTIAQSLANHDNKWAALAISGALFAIFHANPAQTLHQFVLGVLLTLLVLRSGSLWTSVIVHFFNNALVVVISYTPLGADEYWSLTANTKVALPLMLAGMVGFALSVLLYVKTTKSRWQQPSSTDEEEVANDETNHRSSNGALIVGVFVCAVLWIAQLLIGVI